MEAIREAIEDLCDQTGDKDHTRIREFAHEVIRHANVFDDFGRCGSANKEKNLLKAAIINGFQDVVKDLLRSTSMKYVFEHPQIYNDILPDPLWLAGASGNLETISAILKSDFGPARQMLISCLAGAISHAHLGAINWMAFDHYTGIDPVNYGSRLQWLIDEIPFGIIGSKDSEFLKSLSPAFHCFNITGLGGRHPDEATILEEEPDPKIETILYRVIASRRERIDTAVTLLSLGADLTNPLSEASPKVREAIRNIPYVYHPWKPVKEEDIQRFRQKALDQHNHPGVFARKKLYDAMKLGRVDKVRDLLESGLV